MKNIIIAAAVFAATMNTFASVPAIVAETTDDCIIIVDQKGDEWIYEKDKSTINIDENDHVMMIVDDMGNDFIYDDEIIALVKVEG